jgi:hypothetical protein
MKQTKFVLLAISLFALTLNLQVSAQDNVTCGEDVTYQGETYETIQIGKQCWFKKNLNVGTMINVQKVKPKTTPLKNTVITIILRIVNFTEVYTAGMKQCNM